MGMGWQAGNCPLAGLEWKKESQEDAAMESSAYSEQRSYLLAIAARKPKAPESGREAPSYYYPPAPFPDKATCEREMSIGACPGITKQGKEG